MSVPSFPPLPLARTVEIGSRPYALDALPAGVGVLEGPGLAAAEGLEGQVLHRSRRGTLYETRATFTPGGDLLLMFPEGSHYNCSDAKANTMLAFRSSDRGRTWEGPAEPLSIDYNQHGFIPLIPRGSRRICCFGTQPVWTEYVKDARHPENAPIGWLWSDDDGRSFQGPRLIRPVNDPCFQGMAVMRMCETDKGTWLIAPHTGDNQGYPKVDSRLYVLRSEDQGETWTVAPGARPAGWQLARRFNRMDEGRPVALGPRDGRVLMLARTPEGRLWALWSQDDGRTWTFPRATPLVHPDAPPMLALLADGRTLLALHHNRFHAREYAGLDVGLEQVMRDRSEIWASMSRDGGETWTEPGFLYANAVEGDWPEPFFNHQCSYNDIVVDGDTLHIFLPHRWRQALHLTFPASRLADLPRPPVDR